MPNVGRARHAGPGSPRGVELGKCGPPFCTLSLLEGGERSSCLDADSTRLSMAHGASPGPGQARQEGSSPLLQLRWDVGCLQGSDNPPLQPMERSGCGQGAPSPRNDICFQLSKSARRSPGAVRGRRFQKDIAFPCALRPDAHGKTRSQNASKTVAP
jgi:hypothetical protein